MFKKRNWSNWESVCFVEKFNVGCPTYELLRRTDDTGLVQWKMVFIGSSVHGLAQKALQAVIKK